MTAPRQVLPGRSYLITRRCTQRQFWLLPSELTNQIVTYCLAIGAARAEIKLHAICVLSNHYHAVITDPKGRLPQFLHWVNEYIAKCVNASYGRWENLWASEPPNVVWLVDDAAVLDKLVYCLANPVSSGLVPHGSQWPGLRTSPRDVGGTGYEVLRPPIFFRENGPMPVSATLAIERPAICPHLSDAELADHVQELVARREAEIRDEFVCSGRRFLGVKAVLRQQPSDSPNTIERRRSLSPRVVAKSKRSRVEALLRLKSFWMGHREALLLWRAGDRDVEFPAGTYAMRVFHGAACASGSSP